MIENAVFLRFKPCYLPRTSELRSYPFELIYKKLTPESLVDRYRNNEGVEITSKGHPTIWDLLSSKVFIITDYYHDLVFAKQLVPIEYH